MSKEKKIRKVKLIELPGTNLKSGLMAYQLVDEETGEKGGLIDEGVIIGENVWVEEGSQVITFYGSRVALMKDVVIEGKSKIMAFRSDVTITDSSIDNSTLSLNNTRKDREKDGLRKLSLNGLGIVRTNVNFQHITGTITNVKSKGKNRYDRAYFNINENTTEINASPAVVDIKDLYIGDEFKITFNIEHVLIINGFLSECSSSGNIKFAAKSLIIEEFKYTDTILFNFNYGPIDGVVILENCSGLKENRKHDRSQYMVKGSTAKRIFNECNDWNGYAY